MAQRHVLEGAWEEIKLHEAELAGRHVQVIILSDEKPPLGTIGENGHTGNSRSLLRGRGLLAGVLHTEDFLRHKREETAREDRPLR